eukprot:gene112-117_t
MSQMVGILCSFYLLAILPTGSAFYRQLRPMWYTPSRSFQTIPKQSNTLNLMPTTNPTITLQPQTVKFATILPSPTSASNLSPRIQKIKELLLQKEILKDITASEFALRLEIKTKENQTQMIDYERLINKLNINLKILNKDFISSKEISNKLIHRINIIKEDLLLISQNLSPKHFQEMNEDEITFNVPLTTSSSSSTDGEGTEVGSAGMNKLTSFRLLVREDGSVDWDGTIASGREVAKFGSELWERLNGKGEDSEGSVSLQSLLSPVQAKLPKTKEIEQLSQIVQAMKEQLQKLTNQRNAITNEFKQQRANNNNNNNNNNNSDQYNKHLTRIRTLNLHMKELSKKIQIMNLNLDMEKICTYIIQELEVSADPSEQRPIIAEVTLIDKQLSALINQDLALYASSFIPSNGAVTPENNTSPAFSNVDALMISESTDDLVSLIDEDELNLITNEVIDLKTRLGLDAQLKPTFDWGSIGKVTSETLLKIKAGLAYFGDGIKTLFSDVQYAWILILRAAQGYTLKPREVNAMRRTGKDLLTLIPFTIILIIPLTPIGHVLVFSFIQRFFPEFFPSCFQEKRINLKKLFSEIERKSDDDLYLLSTQAENNLLLTSTPSASSTDSSLTNPSRWNQKINDFFKSFTSSDESNSPNKN